MVIRFSLLQIYDSLLGNDTGASFTLFDYQLESFSDADILGAGLYDIWAPLFQDALENRMLLKGWSLYDLTGAGWPTAIAEDLTHNDRCSALLGEPAQNCVCIKRKDNLPGRTGRGRIFLSGFSSLAFSLTGKLDTIDPTWAAGVAIANQMKAPISIAGGGAGFPVIWHRATNTATAVVSTSIQQILCTRRSKRTWRFDDVPQT